MALLSSCGKSAEQSTEELNKAFAALYNLVESSGPFIKRQSDADSVSALNMVMNGEQGMEFFRNMGVKQKFLTSLDSVSTMLEFYIAESEAVGDEIKAAKPSKEELQKAHDKLGDMHIKYVSIMDYISNPSGTVSDWNRKMLSFSDEWREFQAWWTREMK